MTGHGRLPQEVVAELELLPQSKALIDALVASTEQLTFTDPLKLRLANALLKVLQRGPAEDDETTWTAIRRLGALLPPTHLSFLASFLVPEWPEGSRLAVVQTLAKRLTPDLHKAELSEALQRQVCATIDVQDRSGLTGALAANALAALGAVNDSGLPELAMQLVESAGTVFRRQLRRRLDDVRLRLLASGLQPEAIGSLVEAVRLLS